MAFSCLLVGEPGSGKTTAACTAPGPIGVIDFDNKLHKMENLKKKLDSKEVIQIAIDTPLSKYGLRRLSTEKPDQKTVVERPEGYLKFVSAMEALEKSGYVYNGVKLNTLVVDSYTALQEHLKRLLMAANDKSSMTLPLYGVLLANLEEVNNTLVRMPINVVVICHQRIDKNELTGTIKYYPFVEGQMSTKIGKEFEEIYYMQKTVSGIGATATARYEMMTLGDNMRDCRTSRALPALVEPDFCKIYGIKK